MKLWFIIYVGSQIGGTAGPLPYDMAECQRRAAEQNTQWQEQLATGHDLQGNPVTEIAKSMHFGCIFAPQRPANTYKDARA